MGFNMAMAPSPSDPVEALSDLVDGFTAYVRRAERTERRSVKYRANLLWVHALCAVVMGPLFAATPREALVGPAWYFLKSFPASPISVGMALGIGGFILGMGAILDIRKLKVIGLVMLGCWYLMIAISFGLPAYLWATGALPSPPTLYAPVLYLHLTFIMVVHVGSQLRRVRR